MKNLIKKIKSSFKRKYNFEKKFGIPFDHFLHDAPDGSLFFAEPAFLEFLHNNGGDYHDFKEAIGFMTERKNRIAREREQKQKETKWKT